MTKQTDRMPAAACEITPERIVRRFAELGVQLNGVADDSRKVRPGDLFMAYRNERNFALFQSVQKTDDSVPAETEDLLHPPGLQKLHELKRYQVFTHILPHLR